MEVRVAASAMPRKQDGGSHQPPGLSDHAPCDYASIGVASRLLPKSQPRSRAIMKSQ